MAIDMKEIDKLVEDKDYWKAQQLIVDARNAASSETEKNELQAKIDAVYEIIKKDVSTTKEKTKVKFGTSGWRGIIGDDYTLENVKRVTQAVVNMMKSDEFLQEIGVSSFEDVQKKGGLIGFDSRFMGADFAYMAGRVLTGNGISINYAGMSTTAELSGAVVELGNAFSINLTPSHNPFEWAGYKFNPCDGGPAGPNLTTIIESECEKIMDGAPINLADSPEWNEVDTIDSYKEFIARKNEVINLGELIEQINATDIKLVFDNVHGATRGRMERLLDGVDSSKMSFLRTTEDTLFGGVKPEPSPANMKLCLDELAKSDAKFKIGCIMDPDGDRVRFTDGSADIDMNIFGALALYFINKVKGVKGSLAKSVATSNFANAVADKLGLTVNETAVGFKEFRSHLNSGAIVAFEESDGITIGKHTLEKDALIGALLSIKMVLDMGKNLGEIRDEVKEFAGSYYPGKDGAEVDRSLAGAPLKAKLGKLDSFNPGDQIQVGGAKLKIKDKLTLDGYKFVLEDGSWLLIRPSGTEPKVRFYVEGRNDSQMKDLMKTADGLLQDCLK